MRFLSIAASLVLIVPLPALGGEQPGVAGTPAPITMPIAPVDEDESLPRQILKAPAGAAGVCAGIFVGVPVKVAKTVQSETKRMLGTLRDDLGSEKSWDTVLWTSFLALPYGLASGTVLGTIRGVEGGLKHGYDHPFSPESMSLSDPEDQ